MTEAATIISPAKRQRRRPGAAGKASLRLITPSEFAARYFEEGSAPDARTIRTWIEQGIVPGRVIGKLYYVDAGGFERAGSTGNDLADLILNGSSPHAHP